jgi:hypothetical protein
METSDPLDRRVRYTVRMQSRTSGLLKAVADKENRSGSKQMEYIIRMYATLYHKQILINQEVKADGRTL